MGTARFSRAESAWNAPGRARWARARPTRKSRCTFMSLPPRCQLRSLFAKQCPADTAVGYIVVAAPGGGRVVAGKPVVYSESSKPYLELWSSLIYNLEPAPGFPAQFGLNLQGFPYVLDAKLRSDGDYGVTVDDSAIAEPLLGSRLTFCENGAKVDTLETTLKYSCQPAPAETKPFNS